MGFPAFFPRQIKSIQEEIAMSFPVSGASKPIVVALLAVAMLSTHVHAGSPARTEPRPWDFLEMPPECHAQFFESDGFTDYSSLPAEYQTGYAKSRFLSKYDVVCVGPSIEIKGNLRTNGGNVYIFADDVRISGQIDTRIYRRYDLASFFLPQPKRRNSYAGKYWPIYKSKNVYSSLTYSRLDEFYQSKELFASYRQQYECKDCVAIQGSEKQLLPRMPDGFTPPFGSDKRTEWAGLPPASDGVDRLAYRSGDIFIFAGRLEIGGASSHPKLIASGLPGGVGGLGEPHHCAGWPKQSGRYTFSCILAPGDRSLSAPGGAGGDAGSITIVSSEERGVPIDVASATVSGGKPASGRIYRGPAMTRTVDLKGDLSDFEIVEERTPAKSGADGIFASNSVPAAGMLSYFLDIVRLGTVFRPYESRELVSRAIETNRPVFNSIDEYLSVAMDRALRARLSFYVRAAGPMLSSGATGEAPISHSIFCGESGGTKYAQFNVLHNMMLQTCTRNAVVLNTQDYLIALGGVFVKPRPELGTEWRLDKLVHTTLTTGKKLDEIKVQLSKLNQTALDTFHQLKMQDLNSQKSALQRQIDAIEAAKDAKPGTFETLVKAGIAIYTGGAAVAAAYAVTEKMSEDTYEKGGKQVEYTRKDRLGQWKELGNHAEEAFSYFREGRAILAARDEGADAGDVTLRAQLQEINRAMRSLTEEVNIRRAALQRQEVQFASDVFHSTNTIITNTMNGTFSVPELLRVLITAHVADPSRDISRFVTNTLALAAHVESGLEDSLNMQVSYFDPGCANRRVVSTGNWTRASEDCIELSGRDATQVVYGTVSTISGPTIQLPLYRVAPGPAISVLSLYSVKEYSVH
jgi:hypothetical protein